MKCHAGPCAARILPLHGCLGIGTCAEVPHMNNKTVLLLGAYFTLTFWSAAAPGDPDTNFSPRPDGPVTSTALLPDGQILIGGVFDHVGLEGRSNIAKLSPNGDVDGTFLPAANNNVNSIAVLDDGRVVIGGSFTTAGGFSRHHLARLNANGEVDTTFNPDFNNTVYSMALQTDGKLVVVGGFTGAGGRTRNRVLRFNDDDSLDTFNPNVNEIVRSVAVLPDGGMVIGGNFTAAGGMTRNHLARLSAAGSVDGTFNPNVNGNVYCVVLRPDGKVIIGGAFSTVGGAVRFNIARINADGTPDSQFTPSANDIVRSISLQTDGKLIVGGNLTAINGSPCGRLARLNADGTLDPSFNRTGANSIVYTAALDNGGRIVGGGDFTSSGTIPGDHLARFENDPSVQSLVITENNRILWMRSGTCPETQLTAFELSSGGGWTALGHGTRIAGGWELSGLSLPPNAIVRARARVVSGISNGSSGLVEARTLSSLENWRQSHFGFAVNTGVAADTADPDQDGLENLVEYAFGLDPLNTDSASLPAWHRDDDDSILDFVSPAYVSGITCHVEQNTSLDPGGWTALPNSATPPHYTFDLPAEAGTRRFLRFRVTAP
jgi:uncharacterized delta-60 repeat protein